MTPTPPTAEDKRDLLPCPFCGCKETEFSIGTKDREGVPKCIICPQCGCYGPWEYEQGESLENARAAWNTRAKDAERGDVDLDDRSPLEAINSVIESFEKGELNGWELQLVKRRIEEQEPSGGVPEWLLCVERLLMEDVVALNFNGAYQPHHVAVLHEIMPMISEARKKWREQNE